MVGEQKPAASALPCAANGLRAGPSVAVSPSSSPLPLHWSIARAAVHRLLDSGPGLPPRRHHCRLGAMAWTDSRARDIERAGVGSPVHSTALYLAHWQDRGLGHVRHVFRRRAGYRTTHYPDARARARRERAREARDHALPYQPGARGEYESRPGVAGGSGGDRCRSRSAIVGSERARSARGQHARRLGKRGKRRRMVIPESPARGPLYRHAARVGSAAPSAPHRRPRGRRAAIRLPSPPTFAQRTARSVRRATGHRLGKQRAFRAESEAGSCAIRRSAKRRCSTA